MKLTSLASIESTVARRLALVLHAPVVAWSVALFLVESVVNTVRNFAVATVHNVSNFAVGVLTSFSAAGQDFADFMTKGFRAVASDLSFVWHGAAKGAVVPPSLPAPAPALVGMSQAVSETIAETVQAQLPKAALVVAADAPIKNVPPAPPAVS